MYNAVKPEGDVTVDTCCFKNKSTAYHSTYVWIDLGKHFVYVLHVNKILTSETQLKIDEGDLR